MEIVRIHRTHKEKDMNIVLCSVAALMGHVSRHLESVVKPYNLNKLILNANDFSRSVFLCKEGMQINFVILEGLCPRIYRLLCGESTGDQLILLAASGGKFLCNKFNHLTSIEDNNLTEERHIMLLGLPSPPSLLEHVPLTPLILAPCNDTSNGLTHSLSRLTRLSLKLKTGGIDYVIPEVDGEFEFIITQFNPLFALSVYG